MVTQSTTQSSTSGSSADLDLRQFVLMDGTLGPQNVCGVRAAISGDFAKFDLFCEAVVELQSQEKKLSPAGRVRLGVCLLFIGRFAEAEEVLASGDGGA